MVASQMTRPWQTVTLLTVFMLPCVNAGRNLRAQQVPAVDVERAMLAQLAASLTHPDGRSRIDELEAALSPMFAALPKDEHGGLGHNVVRYALHRLFMNRRSWFIRGLDPNSDTQQFQDAAHGQKTGARASLALDSLPVLPSLLQDSIERRHNGAGMSLRETAALAAALEDLAHREAVGKLNMSYEVLGMSPAVNTSLPAKQANLTVATYMTIYLLGHNFSNWTIDEIRSKEYRLFQTKRWHKIHDWIDEVQADVAQQDGIGSTDGSMSFKDITRVVEALGEQFGSFNDIECRAMKHTLLDMEGKFPGRVRLSDFYNRSRYGVWGFAEHIEYLRVLGALDESNASNPQVIVPNYVASMPQCLKGSSVYSTCCRNECEELMGSLEMATAAPEADPDQLLSLVSQLTTDTVKEARTLPDGIRARLKEVAQHNGGRVPLHGRLFAQWMHHAFPRECPYPHKAGTTSPYTPDEWMQQTGRGDSQASDEEMEQHIRPDDSCSASDADQADSELPWSYSEELITSQKIDLATLVAGGSRHVSVEKDTDWLMVGFCAILVSANVFFFLWSKSRDPKKVNEAASFFRLDSVNI